MAEPVFDPHPPLAGRAYHGNPSDPQDRTPHLIRYEHARNVIFEEGGSVVLRGVAYTKENFDRFPRQLEYGILPPAALAQQAQQVKVLMEKLERQRDQLMEAVEGQPPDQQRAFKDLLREAALGRANVPFEDRGEPRGEASPLPTDEEIAAEQAELEAEGAEDEPGDEPGEKRGRRRR